MRISRLAKIAAAATAAVVLTACSGTTGGRAPTPSHPKEEVMNR